LFLRPSLNKEITLRSITGSIAWFIATLYVVYSFTLTTAAAVFAKPIELSLHITTVQATLSVVSFIVGFAVMQIPAGYLLDRFKARYVVSSGLFILALGNLLTSQSNTMTYFTVSNFIQGIGASFAFTSAGVLIGQWFADSLFPIMFGLTQTLSCILSGILHYVLADALKRHSWNHLYLILSIAGFILFILSLIFIKNPAEVKAQKGRSLYKSVAEVCSRPQIWLCAVGAATSFGVLLSYAGFWYAEVQAYYHVSNEQSMIISAIIFIGVGIGTPLLGWVSNIFQSRKMLVHVSLSLGVIFLLAGIYMPNFQMQNLAVTKAISFLIGFLLSGSMLFYTIVNEIMPAAMRGVALSVTNTAVFLFNSLLMFLPYIFTTSKDYKTTLWVMPAWIMIAILTLYFINDSYKNTTTKRESA
jgi:MFS family permease